MFDDTDTDALLKEALEAFPGMSHAEAYERHLRIISHECPRCGSQAGTRCVSDYPGLQGSTHQDRIELEPR